MSTCGDVVSWHGTGTVQGTVSLRLGGVGVQPMGHAGVDPAARAWRC